MIDNQSRISHFQLVIDDSQATALERKIANMYWSIEDNGAWSYKTTDIRDILDLPPQVSAVSAIRGSVKVVIPGLCCPGCGELLLLRDRNHFNPILRKLILGHAPKDLCSSCESCEKAEATLQAKLEEESRNARLAPQREALRRYDASHSVDHTQLSSKHAFMTGAIVYAFGGDYKNRRIPSWFQAGKPPLMRTTGETIDFIKELYSAGAIVPDPDGPVEHVSLDERGRFNFDVLKTGFLIARSSDGPDADIEEDLLTAAKTQEESFLDYFELAAMSEIRDYFLYLHERYRYGLKAMDSQKRFRMKYFCCSTR